MNKYCILNINLFTPTDVQVNTGYFFQLKWLQLSAMRVRNISRTSYAVPGPGQVKAVKVRNPPLQQCQKPDSETHGGASSSGGDGTTYCSIKPPKASVMKVILRVIIGNIPFIKIRNCRLCQGAKNWAAVHKSASPWL